MHIHTLGLSSPSQKQGIELSTIKNLLAELPCLRLWKSSGEHIKICIFAFVLAQRVKGNWQIY